VKQLEETISLISICTSLLSLKLVGSRDFPKKTSFRKQSIRALSNYNSNEDEAVLKKMENMKWMKYLI